MQQDDKKYYIQIFIFLAFFSLPLQADLLQSATISAINTEYNSTSWAATNLRDDDPLTKWLSKSSSYVNDINFQFNASGDAFCFANIDLVNYGNDDRSVKQFMLLSGSDVAISADTGTSASGWRPAIADASPSGLIDYLSWAQGGRLVSVDSEYNATSWGAKNIHDGNPLSKWLSKSNQSINTLEYNFDTDWNGSTGNGIPIDEIEVINYGNDDRSINELQIEVTTDGSNWFKLEVPGTAANDIEYVYSQRQEGGKLGAINNQYNTTSWGAINIQDGNPNSRWLSKSYQGNNTIEFTFDPNNNGLTGAQGDGSDLFNIDKIYLENYGADDRSVKEFQVAVKTFLNPSWRKINVPGAVIGAAGYDFLLSHHGGDLVAIDSQLNSTSWGADNIHDGDSMTRWLSARYQVNNSLEFQFDVNEDGSKNNADYFTLTSFYLQNYGNDDRSIKQFQLAVKTASNTSWQKINVPGAAVGVGNYNFLLKDHGGVLSAVNSQLNSSSWGAKNIHDGSHITRWLSARYQSNNTLEFQFDVNEDGSTATVSDYFTMGSFYLENYGVDDRSIKEFQVAVKTVSQPTWQKINVPGATIGAADHNFLLADHGGVLTAVDSQLNTSSWGAKNMHDGSGMTRWLAARYQSNNTLDFQFDVNDDGVKGGVDDLFIMETFYLQNYGLDDRSIKEFQIEVKTNSNTSWAKVQVPGTAANDPSYNFSLAAHGGKLTAINSQLNSTSWGAKNTHDGNQMSRWLSLRYQFANTLEFAFDTDNNGSTGDAINLDTIELINYGNDDRSIQTFEIDIQISGGAWQAVNAPGGGTIFTANMNNTVQTWAVTPETNVTATRVRTLSNYGDPDYIGATEINFLGASVGPSYTFTAAMHADGQTFTLVAPIVDVTDVRLKTINNHGDPDYVGANEFKVLGPSIVASSTFVAAMHGNGETFTLDTPLVDVTDVKLITINNHGDPDYVGAIEFKVLGASITETKTFVAAMHGNGETFTLDNDDIPVDVTDVKLITINNHGDPDYVGATAFKVLGSSITETKTFVAAMHGNGEAFVLDNDDVPVGVTEVKFISINNYGDSQYVGAAEFEVIGRSVTPAHTFTLPMQAEPYRIALDSEDTVTGVIGARIVTIRNHGDTQYIGAAEFKLLGNAIGPSYVFEANMDSTTQNFPFDPITGNLLRFRSLNNHGDPSYTGAAELVLKPGVCNSLEAHFLFNEGSGQYVADTSGNARTGTLGATNSIESQDPSWVCEATGYQLDFDQANNQRLTTSAFSPPAEGAIAFWMKVPSLAVSSSRVFGFGDGYEIRFEADGYLYMDINKTGTNTTIRTSAAITAIDTWMHFAVTTNTTTNIWKVYKNGVLDNSGTEALIAQPSSVMTVGGSTSQPSSASFTGSIEDFRVYTGELTTAEIVALAATLPVECSPIDHYEIVHDAAGLTCEAEPVTIKACLNESCSELASDPVSLDFKIDNSLHSSLTFTGSTTVNVSNTSPTTLALSIANPSVEPPNPLICDDSTGTSCDLTFSSAGFRFLYGAGNATTIPVQTAGTSFTENLKVQAVKDLNGVCTALFSGNKNVSLAQQNFSPSGTSGLAFTVGGSAIGKHPLFENTSLTFNSDSIAEIPTPNYLDAGQIRLHASFNEGGISLEGSSNAFWVSPDKLIVTAQSTGLDLNSNSVTAGPIHKAGVDFDLVVTAINAIGDVTPNYSPGQIQLLLTRTGPVSGTHEGDFTYANGLSIASAISPSYQNVTLSSFMSGVSSFTQAKYSEVGLLTLDLQDNNYGGASINIQGDLINIGRFIPDHFTLSAPLDGALSGGNGFVYVGQMNSVTPTEGEISYAIEPEFTITANSASGTTTRNYTGDFMRLLHTGVSRVEPVTDATRLGADVTNKVNLTTDLKTPNLSESNGVITYQFNSNDNFFYVREANAIINSFTSDITLKITSITDEDGVVGNDTDADGTNGIISLNPFGIDVYFARWYLANSFGPETSNVHITMEVQYYNGSTFTPLLLENSQVFDATDVNISNISLSPSTTNAIGTGTFSGGRSNAMYLTPPVPSKKGAVSLEYPVPSWLQFDWLNTDNNFDGPYNQNPTAVTNFGAFRGNDRIISWREAGN